MKLFNVGKIINTHGVRGELKILRISDFTDRFEKGNELILVDHQKKELLLTIEGHRIHKGFDLLKVDKIPDLTTAEIYKNCFLKIKKEQLTPLEKNEFYYHEIIDCSVETDAGELVGQVKEILSPGANDVWVVQRENKKDALIPYIAQVVQTIDVEAKKITITPMEGLLD